MFMANIVLSCSGFLDPRPFASSSSCSLQRLFLRPQFAALSMPLPLPLPLRRPRPDNPHAVESSSSSAPASLELVSTTVCSDGSIIFRFGASTDVKEVLASDRMPNEAVEAVRLTSDMGNLSEGDFSGCPEPTRRLATEEVHLVVAADESRLEMEEVVDRKFSTFSEEEVTSRGMQDFEHIRTADGLGGSSISVCKRNSNADVEILDNSGKLHHGINSLEKVEKLLFDVKGDSEIDGTDGSDWNVLEQKKDPNFDLGKLEIEKIGEDAGAVEGSADNQLQDGKSSEVNEVNLEEKAESSNGVQMISGSDGKILHEERCLVSRKEVLEHLLLQNEDQEEHITSVELPRVQQGQEISYLSIKKVYLSEGQDSDLEEMMIYTTEQENLQDDWVSDLKDNKSEESDHLPHIYLNPVSDERTNDADQLADDIEVVEEDCNAETVDSAVTVEDNRDIIAPTPRKNIAIARPMFSLFSGAAMLPHPLKALAGGEDAYFVACKNWLGVADGVGQWSLEGINAGLFAREIMENSAKLISNFHEDLPYKPAQIISQSALESQCLGSSTILVSYFDGQVLRVANIGDSGFIILRHGQVIHRSTPMVYGLSFPLRIKRKDDTSRLTEVYTIELVEGDIVITATDGLFDNLYEQEIIAIISKSFESGFKPMKMAELLAMRAQEVGRSTCIRTPFADAAHAAGYPGFAGGKLDDVTVIVSIVQD